MSENEPEAGREGAAPPDPAGEERGPVTTPFDNPLFLPVLLWLGAGWFGFDIVTNAEAYQKYPNFNRGGFVVLLLAALWFTWSAIKEKRAASRGDS